MARWLTTFLLLAGCHDASVRAPQALPAAEPPDAATLPEPTHACAGDVRTVAFPTPVVPGGDPRFGRVLACTALELACCYGDDGRDAVRGRAMTVIFEPAIDGDDRSLARLERPPIEPLSASADACLRDRISRWELRPMLRGDVLVTPFDPRRDAYFPPASIVASFHVASEACE